MQLGEISVMTVDGHVATTDTNNNDALGFRCTRFQPLHGFKACLDVLLNKSYFTINTFVVSFVVSNHCMVC